jgi:DNA recombination protein RmuC
MSSLFPFLVFLLGFGFGAGVVYFFLSRTSGMSEASAESIAARIAMKQTDQLLRLAEEKLGDKKEAIDGTLKVMKTDMKDELLRVETLLKSLGETHTKSTERLDTRLEHAARTIKDLNDTTTGLKSALAGNSTRGQWGERMAEDVLRLAGFVEGINFIKQKKLESAGSKPDFTFLLPQNLTLNMDVKFPFNNYQLYVSAATDAERDAAKKQFLRDVKLRIKEVQTRDYINPEDHTVDYVLLFVPNEQIFSFINESDQSIIDEAIGAKTILCSPLSLYAILAVIRQSIDNFNVEQKSGEIMSLFGAFRQQWEKFKEQMETVGKRFESVRTGYEDLMGARVRQLDKPLARIDELREQKGIALPSADGLPLLDQPTILQNN